MGAEEFAALIERMPEIATAVNAFKSDTAQARALEALVSAYLETDGKTDPKGGKSAPPRAQVAKRANKAAKVTKAAKGGGARKGPKQLGDLDLRPKNKQSFHDFIEEKKPPTVVEKVAAVVYWLQNTLQVEAIGEDHVYTCYKSEWKPPDNMRNAMQQTKSKKAWIETADMDDVTMTTAGSHTVEYDLPPKAK